MNTKNKTSSNPGENRIEKIFNYIHKFFFRTFLVNSVCILTLFLSLRTGILEFLGFMDKSDMVNIVLVANIMIFSLLIGVALLITDLLKETKLNTILVYTINFALCYGAFYVWFYTQQKALIYTTWTSIIESFLLLSIVFVGVYFLVFAISSIAEQIKMTAINNSKEYKPVINSKKNKK